MESVFYFTAYATWLDGPYRRHQLYVEALEAMQVTTVIGNFKKKQRQCLKCKERWDSHEEKQTDVNFAIHLLHQAYIDGFDKALLITADSDLCPAVDLVLDTFPQKEIVILTPPKRYKIAREIRSKVQTLKIKRAHLEVSLLPEHIYDEFGQCVSVRPPEYTP